MSKFKMIKRTAKLLGGAAVIGAGVGYSQGSPGLRKEAAVEGAVTGMGLALGAKFIFRKIKGRIIRMKVKK